MPKGNPEIANQARKGGKASARSRLSLARVEAELGPLETVDDAMRRLNRLNLWISAGLLSGSQGSAAVRSIEVWLRGHESRLTEKVVEELSGEVQRLQEKIAAGSARAVP